MSAIPALLPSTAAPQVALLLPKSPPKTPKSPPKKRAQQKGFWGWLGHGFNNLFHAHSWNYIKATVTVEQGPMIPIRPSGPNPYVSVGADALSIAGAATGHPAVGYAGAAISVKNDPSPANLILTGASFVPGLGEAVGAETAVQDVGLLVGKWVTNNIMAPVLAAAPPDTIDDGNGHTIPAPNATDVCEALGGNGC
jgi:hypothetical protein